MRQLYTLLAFTVLSLVGLAILIWNFASKCEEQLSTQPYCVNLLTLELLNFWQKILAVISAPRELSTVCTYSSFRFYQILQINGYYCYLQYTSEDFCAVTNR